MPTEGIAGTLPQYGLIAITWAGVALATIFLIGRTVIRLTRAGSLRVDDYLIYAAFAVLVINAGLQTKQTPDAYDIAKVQAGLIPVDEKLIVAGTRYLKYEFTIIGLFWTVLWLVKASFLAFFYHLFDGLPKYRRIWWGVVVFAFLAYSGCWIASINNCHPAHDYFIFGACNKPIDLRGSVIAISYSTTVDILTDVMIMAMPLNLIWTVKITRREKMGLAAVFSVGVIIIVFAVIRAVQITFTARTDAVLLSLWGILESSVSVVVGCLPPYKTLFAARGNTNAYSGGSYGNRYNNSGTPRRNGSIPLDPYTPTSTKINGSRGAWEERSESREGIVGPYPDDYPQKDIMVRKEVVSHSGSEPNTNLSWLTLDPEHQIR